MKLNHFFLVGAMFVAANDEMDFPGSSIDIESFEDSQEDEAGSPMMGEKEASSFDMPPPTFENLPYRAPRSAPKALLSETFQGPLKWEQVSARKFSGHMAVVNRVDDWIEGDSGLRMMNASMHHGWVRSLDTGFSVSKGDSLYGSLEVEYEDKVSCGGAYFKLFDDAKARQQEPDLSGITAFDETTPYSIMFGPDKCGYMTNKVHLIIKYPHPLKQGEWVEEHLDNAPKVPTSSGPHQYGFAIHPDGTAQVFVDGAVAVEGKMKEIFQTKFSNEKTVEDKTDKKPEDWVEDAMIPDPNASKPEDWDEDAPEMILDEDAVMPDGWLEDAPEKIPNPEAERPEDWDDDVDGEWIAPMIDNPACYIGCGEWKRPMKSNPAYKGAWKAPLIDNPDYKGPWEPRQIPNEHHFDIEKPYSVVQPFNSIGFELWTVDVGAMFDNILITTNKGEYDAWVEDTYKYKADTLARNFAARAAYEEKKTGKKSEDARIDAEASSSSFFTRLVNGLMILAAENKLVALLCVGLPIATMGYVINRVVRRGVDGLKGMKPAKQMEAATEPATGSEKADDKTKAATDESSAEVSKKGEEKKSLRQRKGDEKVSSAQDDGKKEESSGKKDE